ncbi:MAG: hypothetical protein AB7J35_21125 [Dehalococcoidia bacterium]
MIPNIFPALLKNLPALLTGVGAAGLYYFEEKQGWQAAWLAVPFAVLLVLLLTWLVAELAMKSTPIPATWAAEAFPLFVLVGGIVVGSILLKIASEFDALTSEEKNFLGNQTKVAAGAALTTYLTATFVESAKAFSPAGYLKELYARSWPEAAKPPAATNSDPVKQSVRVQAYNCIVNETASYQFPGASKPLTVNGWSFGNRHKRARILAEAVARNVI